jgi:hypothetical protein
VAGSFTVIRKPTKKHQTPFNQHAWLSFLKC